MQSTNLRVSNPRGSGHPPVYNSNLETEILFGVKQVIVLFTSASSRCLDRGDVDLLHRHHRLEGAFCLTATGRKRLD
jgi:hypothetical protein